MTKPTLYDRLRVQNYPNNQVSLMDQKWSDILFVNWECDPKEIQKTLPKELSVDTFQGKAYMGIQAFKVEEAKLKSFFFSPRFENFLALNIQTYVYDQNRVPGIWFYSLLADQKLVVELAKQFLTLPYHYTKMEILRNSEKSTLMVHQEKHPLLSWQNSLRSPDIFAETDSLEFFLLERYVVYTLKQSLLKKGFVYHSPFKYSLIKILEFTPSNSLHSNFLPYSHSFHAFFSSHSQIEIFKPI
ncbi:DUF2071 domain-containing protein [Candidatus Protochlamydia sp. W-9]|uniref:DUF2071 domain-containing protein n=1 Tax=Candidatus Protochlamydia sp. W-9 TaxID=1785087 RepID=UPI00096A9E75|nr:DUF2071 domain-containing protein [Candidatus Protochlamydia sp. W-9]